MQDLLLLDCTLRDGGYINSWKWGYENSKAIIRLLVRSGIDVIEVGFLRDVEVYDEALTTCNYIEELNKLLPQDSGNVMFSAMAMRSNYDISKLSDYSGNGIELIRITAHDYDIYEGLSFAQEVKNKGYKVSINPINIMGYSDKQLLEILNIVNEIQPYQFAIVDTFGSMKRRDMDRIVSLVDHNLRSNIRVALHLHENMSLSTSLAQNFVDKHLQRPISIDGSLMGIGRVPGNLPLELIADYLNDYAEKSYDINYLMDAIQDYIEPVRRDFEWGYMPAYFLSARFNVHRNYAEHYIRKGDLSNRDINRLLSEIKKEKSTIFDSEYADEIYWKYKNNIIDDTKERSLLSEILGGKQILVLAPGKTIAEYKDKISSMIRIKSLITISVNFIPEIFDVDFAFFSNAKRYMEIETKKCRIIATSNIKDAKEQYILDYNKLGNVFEPGYNSLIMLLTFLKDIKVGKIFLAGADGYKDDSPNYYRENIKNFKKHSNDYNCCVSNAINSIGLDIKLLTPSAYQIQE